MKREDVVVCYYHRVLWARGFQERRHEISMQTVRQVAERTQLCSNKDEMYSVLSEWVDDYIKTNLGGSIVPREVAPCPKRERTYSW